MSGLTDGAAPPSAEPDTDPAADRPTHAARYPSAARGLTLEKTAEPQPPAPGRTVEPAAPAESESGDREPAAPEAIDTAPEPAAPARGMGMAEPERVASAGRMGPAEPESEASAGCTGPGGLELVASAGRPGPAEPELAAPTDRTGPTEPGLATPADRPGPAEPELAAPVNPTGPAEPGLVASAKPTGPAEAELTAPWSPAPDRPGSAVPEGRSEHGDDTDAAAPAGPGDPAAPGGHSRRPADEGPGPGNRSGRPADEGPAPLPSPATSGTRRPPASRRGGVDPVKALMHRHRELCEGAVDPLEIAAGLEAHGVTDRTAARFRHRDVFSLAEEMFARVSRDADRLPVPASAEAPGLRTGWAPLALLPGALCAAAVTGLHLTHGRTRLLVALAGVLAVGLGVRVALRRGPLGTPTSTHAWHATARTHTWTAWLIAYSLLGDGLLQAAVAGGPDGLPDGTADGPWPLATAPVLALALAFAPASWCARLFAAQARRRLAASRGLEEFTSAVRPLLIGVVALFLGALGGLVALSGAVLHEPAAYLEVLALGALLLLARLLAVHHAPHPAAVALAAAGVAEVAAPALVLAGRLPGCGFLSTPVETLVEARGAGGVPTLVCAVAALTLLFHATRTLTRASAHAPTGGRT